VDAERASMRARELTQQLLTFSEGGAPIKKPTSIATLVKESASFSLSGSNVKCDYSLPDDLWAVEVDKEQMSQVINNIVINAVQAMPQGGLVNISAKNLIINKKGPLPLPKGNYIEVTIEDHGIGMPKDYLDRMFEPYFTTKQKGSGLGLAMAYSIIKNHEGHIAIESTPTVGTTVNIYLPAEKKRISRQRGEEAIQPSLVSQGKVLVMVDEEVIRLLINELLTSTGYEVELSKDGVEAVELYRKAMESGQPFDAVILDLTVPGGMGGRETMKKLLEMDSEVKVIVSSGYSTAPIMSEYKKYGFSAVVTKPYTVSNMEKTLHDVLTKK
jgi:two-component system cell cycle sensor histidine kinase/response regulator CckA